jgi:iron only hydrogenase large subunit-like protein
MGADITIQHEAEELKERLNKEEEFMTTSCCPSYVKLVEKHLPEMENYVSKAHSPMHYTAEVIKKQHPDCITVFLGPCVAKRYESRYDEYVDYMMNFEELDAFFTAKEINIEKAEGKQCDQQVTNAGRGFAISGGVINALQKHVNGAIAIKEVAIDGLSPENIKLLKSYTKGHCPGNFVEVMSCEGGCVAGPGTINNPKAAERIIKRFCGE